MKASRGRPRRQPLDARIEYKDDSPVLISGWKPWPDVSIETFLLPPAKESPNWHLRVHHVKTRRALLTAEGSFCHSRLQAQQWQIIRCARSGRRRRYAGGSRCKSVASAAGAVGLIDIKGGKERTGKVVQA